MYKCFLSFSSGALKLSDKYPKKNVRIRKCEKEKNGTKGKKQREKKRKEKRKLQTKEQRKKMSGHRNENIKIKERKERNTML